MNIYSPWPEKGKFIKVLFPKSYAATVGYLVDYGVPYPQPKQVSWQWWTFRKQGTYTVQQASRVAKFKFGRWPFISIRLGKFGFYIGWKPINLMDRNFAVYEHERVVRACEFAVRFSTNRNEDTDNG